MYNPPTQQTAGRSRPAVVSFLGDEIDFSFIHSIGRNVAVSVPERTATVADMVFGNAERSQNLSDLLIVAESFSWLIQTEPIDSACAAKNIFSNTQAVSAIP